MEGYLISALLLALHILQLFHLINTCTATETLSGKTNTQYIKRSCSVTIYPRLCYHSLSIYAGKIKTDPKVLAHTALNVSLTATQETSVIMRRVSEIHGLKPIETAAAHDCMEEIGDAIDELQQSLDELGHVVGGSNFWLQMSNIQTWVSAALTDEDTCMDGFEEHHLRGRVVTVVRRYTVNVAHLTSNALALINSYASSKAVLPQILFGSWERYKGNKFSSRKKKAPIFSSLSCCQIHVKTILQPYSFDIKAARNVRGPE